jgi:UbiD family decarboxylase
MYHRRKMQFIPPPSSDSRRRRTAICLGDRTNISALLKFQLPEIVDMHLPMEGVFHNCVLVAIKKSFPGHARKIMNSLWGMGQMMFAKYIIVVDETVNVQNVSEVMWKVFNNADPRRIP